MVQTPMRLKHQLGSTANCVTTKCGASQCSVGIAWVVPRVCILPQALDAAWEWRGGPSCLQQHSSACYRRMRQSGTEAPLLGGRGPFFLCPPVLRVGMLPCSWFRKNVRKGPAAQPHISAVIACWRLGWPLTRSVGRRGLSSKNNTQHAR